MRIALPTPARPERVASRGAAAQTLGPLALLTFLATLLGLASPDNRGTPLVVARVIQRAHAVTPAPRLAALHRSTGRS